MSFDLQKILESKRAFRCELAARPIAEKLRILDAPRERELAIRGRASDLASISMTKLKGLPVPIPPLTEQTRIVPEVERRLSVVEELESVVTANLQRAVRLRQSILQNVLRRLC
jgi:restriction endonuclease S subunit